MRSTTSGRRSRHAAGAGTGLATVIGHGVADHAQEVVRASSSPMIMSEGIGSVSTCSSATPSDPRACRIALVHGLVRSDDEVAQRVPAGAGPVRDHHVVDAVAQIREELQAVGVVGQLGEEGAEQGADVLGNELVLVAVLLPLARRDSR
jgi:hypothetical protein